MVLYSIKKKDWEMKKRTFLSLIFLVIFSALFANNVEIFKVGDYTILAIYEGQNNRDVVFKKLKSQGRLTDDKPSREQMEWIKRALNVFETTKGDVYTIGISRMEDLLDGYEYICVCEFSTDTNFSYWFYLLHAPRSWK